MGPHTNNNTNRQYFNAIMAMVMMHMVVRIMSRQAGGHLFWILGQCMIYVCMSFMYVCMDVCMCVFLLFSVSLSLSLSLFIYAHIYIYIHVYVYI